MSETSNDAPVKAASRLKIAVLISGRGSNMEALITACSQPDFPAEIVTVVSNRPDAAGLDHARAAGLSTKVIDHKHHPDRESFEALLHAHLTESGAKLICLAGFMRLLTGQFVEKWRDRVINIHPSLLPSFKGLHTHERVLEAGTRFHGCTVHFVRPEMDDGPIIVQACVPVMPKDTPDSLGARVLVQEHRIYVLALRLVAEGKVTVRGGRALIDSAPIDTALVNPPIGN